MKVNISFRTEYSTSSMHKTPVLDSFVFGWSSMAKRSIIKLQTPKTSNTREDRRSGSQNGFVDTDFLPIWANGEVCVYVVGQQLQVIVTKKSLTVAVLNRKHRLIYPGSYQTRVVLILTCRGHSFDGDIYFDKNRDSISRRYLRK